MTEELVFDHKIYPKDSKWRRLHTAPAGESGEIVTVVAVSIRKHNKYVRFNNQRSMNIAQFGNRFIRSDFRELKL